MEREVGILAVDLGVGCRVHQRECRLDLLDGGGITPTGREGRRDRLDADPELVATLDVGDRLDAREAERCAAHLADDSCPAPWRE